MSGDNFDCHPGAVSATGTYSTGPPLTSKEVPGPKYQYCQGRETLINT